MFFGPTVLDGVTGEMRVARGDLHATGKDGARFFAENKVEISRWLSEPGTAEAVKMPTEVGA